MRPNKHFTTVLVLFIATVAVSVPLYLVVPGTDKEAQVARLPMNVHGWVGRDLPVEESAYEILETRNLILREYAKGGNKVYLYIIYSMDNRRVSHPPEVCFEGSGVTIVKKQKAPMELAGGRRITVNMLLVERKGAMNAVVYWYKAGDAYTDNYLAQQLRIAVNHFKFKKTPGALIRLSAESPSGDVQKALENIRQFAKDVSEYFPAIIP
ncbi:MAG: EpsI family protein [Candidatus Omnitrophica bacterium]|nr:EpsI family protein [Candidatus Omnitrophota bacterium]MDD5574540.1 EpsI family protein [Candidatus Omnitrophota bacterium]